MNLIYTEKREKQAGTGGAITMMIRQKLQENMDTEMGSDSLSRPAGGVPASLSEPLPRGRYALLRGQPIPSRSLTIILCDAFSGPVPVAKDILRESMPIVCGLQVPGNVSIIPGISHCHRRKLNMEGSRQGRMKDSSPSYGLHVEEEREYPADGRQAVAVSLIEDVMVGARDLHD